MRNFEPFMEYLLVRVKEVEILEKYKKNDRGMYQEVTESGFIIPKVTGMEIDPYTGEEKKKISAELSEDQISREYKFVQEGYVVKKGPNVFYDKPGNQVEIGDLVAFCLHSGDDKIKMGDDGHKYVVLRDVDLQGVFRGETLNEQ